MRQPRRRTRIPIDRTVRVALAVIVVTSLPASVAVAAGAYQLQTHWTEGQLLIGIGVFGYAVTAIAVIPLMLRAGWIPTVFAKRMWLGLPRITWIIGAIGLLSAACNFAALFMSPPVASH
jgi:hypothetical protein